ncbi:MAG TPA: GSCFA domain-containing protein [Allosphingosinicella sp.]|nr:GSCFA domain-containing protein [Allosphingosinicella sp.]
MVATTVKGIDAWMAAVRGPATRWKDHLERLSGEVAEVVHRPKFAIGTNDSFFCIGSCFARNIEEHLLYSGVEVLSRKIVCPVEEWPSRVNGFVNKFTTASIRNELEWVVVPPALDSSYFQEQADGGWLDLQLSPHMPPVKLGRATERRAYLTADYFSRIRQASIVVVTLGFNEVWFDRAAGRHLNAAPSFYAARREPDRYELHITDVNDNLTELDEIRRLILSLNPDAKIVVTVSPVPLSETFSGRDVLIANQYSKSVLRAAADLFAHAHSDVDYFPSYDIIANSPRSSAYEPDCLHVADSVVGRVIGSFLRLYLGIESAPPSFDERAYLKANPQVEAAVRRGDLGSGFEHWRSSGGDAVSRSTAAA